MVVTNGDNEYADSLFAVLLDTPADKDIVALNYYSRYARPTAPPCERFLSDGPPCKVNRWVSRSTRTVHLQRCELLRGLAAHTTPLPRCTRHLPQGLPDSRSPR